MNASKLVEMMRATSGNMKAFAAENGLKYTTLYSATKTDGKLENMNLSMFLAICAGLGKTPEEVLEAIKD